MAEVQHEAPEQCTHIEVIKMDEELTIKLDVGEVTVLLDAVGKALGQKGLSMKIDENYIESCNEIIEKLNNAIDNATLIF